MINIKLIEQFKKEYYNKTGRELGEDIYLSSPKPFIQDVDYWLNIICDYFNVTESDIKLRNRAKKYYIARSWYYYIASKNQISHLNIGNRIDRERSNVGQCANKLWRDIVKDPKLRKIELQILNHKICKVK